MADSSYNQQSTRVAFSEKEGFDDLSASFRSLYRSIFSANPPGDGDEETAFETDSTLPAVSNAGTSISLGASAATLFDANHRNCSPQFTSLMDSFRDIAESNNWEKLDPSHIRGLMESFRAGERERFGLDAESFAGVSSSFNQFLDQLHNKFLTNTSSNSNPRLSEYQVHNQLHTPAAHTTMSHPSSLPYYHPSTSSGTGGSARYPALGGGGGGGRRHHHHHSSSGSSTEQQQHSSSSGGRRSQSHISPHYTSYMGQMHGGGDISNHPGAVTGVTGVGNMGPPSTPPTIDLLRIKSVATDLIEEPEDDDDFDWTKLM